MKLALFHTKTPQPPAVKWHLELGMLVAGIAGFAGGEYLRVRRAPRAPAEEKAQHVLNTVDRHARDRLLLKPLHRRHAADRASDALGYFGVPAAVLLWLTASGRRAPPLRLVHQMVRITQAVMVTGALNQIVKVLAPRERPLVKDCPSLAHCRDARGSFFSNHTSAVTALAAAATRMAHANRLPMWPAVPVFGLAGFVGYLRIASDCHYLTDVIAGAGVGTLVGGLLAR